MKFLDKTPERFNNAMTALYNSFMNRTLAKGNCSACAIGNMVAAANGATVTKEFECSIKNNIWTRLFITTFEVDDGEIVNESFFAEQGEVVRNNVFGAFKKRGYLTQREEAIDIIKPTGYNQFELAKVEKSFELNTSIDHNEYKYRADQEILEDQQKGLFAVIDVLCELDGIEKPEEIKSLFDVELVKA